MISLSSPSRETAWASKSRLIIDMCVFDAGRGHERTFPAFSFVASSKWLRKYCRDTEGFAAIVETGLGGNLYAYYEPGEGLVAKHIVVRLGVESIGIRFVDGMEVIILGEMEELTLLLWEVCKSDVLPYYRKKFN
jgi:hypothetical protein